MTYVSTFTYAPRNRIQHPYDERQYATCDKCAMDIITKALCSDTSYKRKLPEHGEHRSAAKGEEACIRQLVSM